MEINSETISQAFRNHAYFLVLVDSRKPIIYGISCYNDYQQLVQHYVGAHNALIQMNCGIIAYQVQKLAGNLWVNGLKYGTGRLLWYNFANLIISRDAVMIIRAE